MTLPKPDVIWIAIAVIGLVAFLALGGVLFLCVVYVDEAKAIRNWIEMSDAEEERAA